MTEQEIKMEKLYPFMDDTMYRDEDGCIMPWYTKQALDWIKENIPQGVTVLEFGGGNSTLWWRKISNVETIEFDERACEILEIKKSSPKQYFEEYPDLRNDIYDVIIVDSEAEISRQEYVKKAFDTSKKYVIIDNWQQPEVCMYDEETVNYLMTNSKEQHIFNEPKHLDGSWKTAIFIK